MKPADKNTNFMSSLCLGKIEEEILFPFPKVKADERETLNTLRDSFASWLKGRDLEFREWDHKGELPNEFLNEMREFGLFSLVIPESFGGLGFSATAYSRTLQELSRYDSSIALTAGAHSSIGMRGLLLFGTAEQKGRFLPKLASGEMIAAFCLTEAGAGSDAAAIKTRAVRDGDDWILTGEKIWITNGGIAQFFTVFAKTDGPEGLMTAFLVTRDMQGVSTGPHEDKMGIRASSTTTVILNQVRVPAKNVLGDVGKGFKVAMKILNSGRTGLGGGCVGMMKRTIALATRQAKDRKQFGQEIANYGLIKQKIGHMVVECYATESVVNMVSGIIDRGYEDYAVEAAISKVFSTESLWRIVDEGLQIAGGNGYMREFPYERMMRDARINRIFEGTNEILRLFIALNAMNDVGHQLKEVAQTIGNVMDDPIKGFGVLSDYSKRKFAHITGFGRAIFSKAHPEIKPYSQIFEGCAADLSSATDRVLRKHGKAIIHKQFAIKRLAEIMIDLFVLASMISRVSQSLEERGSEGAAQEVEILSVFAGQSSRRVRSNFSKIDSNDDEAIKSLADFALKEEKYIWDNI